MKLKIKNEIKFFDYYIGGNLFITLTIFLFVLVFIYAYYVGDYFPKLVTTPNFFDSIILFFQDPIIISSTILIPMILISLNVIHRIEKLGSNLLRYETRKEYLYNLVCASFKANTVYFLIIIFIIMLATFCMISNIISIDYIYEYKTINVLYLIFYLFKAYFIGQWLSILSILTLKSEQRLLSIVINLIIFLSLFFNATNEFDTISSVLNIPLLVGDYLKMLSYNSFVLEILCFAIFSILLMLLENFAYKKCCKKLKTIGEI